MAEKRSLKLSNIVNKPVAEQPIQQHMDLQPSVEAGREGDKVGATYGLTKSIGKFEFARCDVSMETKIGPGETTKQAFNRIWNYIQAEVDEFDRNIEQIKKGS